MADYNVLKKENKRLRKELKRWEDENSTEPKSPVISPSAPPQEPGVESNASVEGEK
jgi:hypothetical protein